MGRPAIVFLLAAALLCAGALAAGAQGDVYIYVTVDDPLAEAAADAAASLLPLGDTAEFLYTTQEDLTATVNSLTGLSGNYYIWACTDTGCVPVDPYTVGN